MDAAGNWRIIGRIKNLIILGSGHNIAPEPIEDEVLQNLPGAQHVVLVGNGRGYLSAIVAGNVTREQVQAALDAVNPQLPHYKQIRAFHIHAEPFSIENGLLTANGKLKRDLIAARLQDEIEEMYGVKQASALQSRSNEELQRSIAVLGVERRRCRGGAASPAVQ
ncbi:MAG: hypothetical protein AUH86_01670 [Acidobacteria bacterium 13_1_40CM_4_58_4]|nr:MAG: hypothetical protein AUH86_01670 [Acidobacteria bacterium 13_1_40CM_4_58_4]